MANPIVINCTKNKWKRVASDINFGNIKKLTHDNYIETYRMHGDPAPTTPEEGFRLFLQKDSEFVFSWDNIDVYIMAVGAAGKVRVDL